MSERSVVKVFNPETEWQGTLIIQELKAAGIEAYLANRSTASIWGGVAPLADLEILVHEESEAQARRTIEEFLSSHGLAPSEETLAREAQETPPPDDSAESDEDAEREP